MTRRLSLLAMTALLPGCDGLDLPFLGGGDAPEEKVVVAPPAPLDLYITSANVNMITVKDGDVEVPAKFEQVDGTFTFDPGGPFYDGECSEDPNDVCGDLEQGVITVYDFDTIFTVPCQDTDDDGAVDIGADGHRRTQRA